MERTLNIAIVGYGIAGIAAAIHLRRLGHSITHFERSDPPIACGAGMLMHSPAMRQLKLLGVLDAALERGATVRRIAAKTIEGRSLLDFSYGDFMDGQCGLGIQRGTLHRLLSEADSGRGQVHAGRKIVAAESNDGLISDDQHVRHGPFDLIVAADGAQSPIRKQLFRANTQDRLAESAALVGLLDDPQRLAADQLMQYFDSARHLSVWPVGTAYSGDANRCSFAINVPLGEVEAIHDSGTWRSVSTRLWPAMRALIRDVQDNDLHVFTYRDVEVAQPFLGRVVLIGDAAHSMSPQLGTGAQLAMEDAATLANAIAQHSNVPDALLAYTTIRRPQLQRYHLASRWLTPLFQSDNRAMSFVRNHLFANAMNLPAVRQLAHALLS